MANPLSVAAGTRKRTTTRRRRNTAKGGVSKAQQQVQRLQNQMKKINLSHKEGMGAVVATLETQSALFATSTLSAKYGTDKIKLWNIDGRLLLGGVLAGYGLMQSFNGESAAGAHALNFGNGILGAAVYEIGQKMGAGEGFSGFSGRPPQIGYHQHAHAPHMMHPAMAGRGL